MKIGEFARKYNVTVDTIRYYMEIELIIPEKVGGQYDFNEECSSNLEEILWLKSADFSLNEIQRIFTLKRFTGLKSSEDMDYYRNLFKNKRTQLISRRDEIDEIIHRIDEKIISTEIKSSNKGMKIGLPLSCINIIACPKCNENLTLHRASIEDNVIFNGELKCKCGFKASISEGIIVLDNDFKPRNFEEPELNGHFIEKTSNEYVNLFYKNFQWISNRINIEEMGSKIILEPGTGSGIFLNNIIKLLPEDALYICVDHNLELLRDTKKNLEENYNKNNLLFICSDFENIPIKNAILDLVMDHYGSSNYNFIKEGFLIHKLQNKVKRGGKWIGGYLNFRPGAKSLEQYPRENMKYYYIENIIKSFEDSKFRTIEMKDMGYTEKGGIYETFFIEGDRLYDFAYFGEKVE